MSDRHPKLATELSDPTYALMNDVDRLSALNTKNIPVKVPIASESIKAYLALKKKWMPIKNSADPAAQEAVELMLSFPVFHVNEPDKLAALIAMLDALIGIGLIDETTDNDKTNILAMGDKLESWADQNTPNLKLWEVSEART